jgi:N-acetylmuramic acid 6-phosphate etherase
MVTVSGIREQTPAELLTEQSYPGADALDELPTTDLLDLINRSDQAIPAAVAAEIPRISAAVEAIVAAISGGGRLFYIGAGTSGRLGVLDASECPPTFGVSPDLVHGIIAGGAAALSRASEASEDDPASGARDLVAAGFSAKDALVGIAASGRTPYVLGAVAKAREVGALTCGISCASDSELSRAVDFPIEPKPGPEVLAGSTRMRAGTATKLVLNMISTAVMIRLGHVYGNLMVNVQPGNEKLRDRARRIIQRVTGVSAEKAAQLLDQSGNNVRVAIVMENKKVTREEAERLLAAAGGRIRGALEESD